MMDEVRRYSDDQKAIIECPDKPFTGVLAYAGCGKSTTLIGYALARMKYRILYLSFNKSVATEAQKSFPKNTECKTMHSLAYSEFGVVFKERLVAGLQPAMVEPFIAIAGLGDLKKRAVAMLAIAAVENFCNTADKSMSIEHLPLEKCFEMKISERMVLNAARNLFTNMIQNSNCPVTHSVYMKLYQLSEPILDYDYILVDEAQDLNPVVMDILKRQKVPRVMVGDPHQSIYSFRGSINSLEGDHIDNTLYLNESYRFGKLHADTASNLLRLYKDVNKPLVGMGKAKGIIQGAFETKTVGNQGLEIFRTNGGLFQRAVELVDPNPDQGLPTKNIYFVGGLPGYNFDRLISAYKLFKDDVGYGVYEGYKSWSDYEKLAETTQDHEMMSTKKTVERYKGRIPVFVNKIKDASCASPKKATVMLTNAHKSKGLEADTVKLGGDFPSLQGEIEEGVVRRAGESMRGAEVDIEEVNLAYVAITRAKRVLGISRSLSIDLDLDLYIE